MTLGPPWVTLGPFGVTLQSLWSHLRHMRVTLGDLRCLGSHSGPTLGTLRFHFGATWVPFLAFEGRCRGLWNHFELTLGSLLAYENEFGIIMVSSYAQEAQFSKSFIFSTNFNDFLKVLYDESGKSMHF